MENVLKGLPNKIRDQLSRHHTQNKSTIAFRLLRRGNMKLHALLGHPVSENFVSWCQTLKNSSASFLCIQEHLFHLPWLKNVYIWSTFVLCMMSGQLISDFVRDDQEVHAISCFLSEADEMQYIGTHRVFPQMNLFFHLGKGASFFYFRNFSFLRDFFFIFFLLWSYYKGRSPFNYI
jgi:hypothetical protein